MMTLESGILMFLAAMTGGLVQSVTGFGAGIVMMVFIPSFLPILQGSAVSTLVSIPMQLVMICQYRKYVRPDYMGKPLIFYILVSVMAISLAAGHNMDRLKVVFGIFLIALSIYFTFFSERLKIQAGWPAAAICGGLSGLASGLFGIGGPPMVLYFLALTGNDKFTYLSTLQGFFLVTALFTTATRAVNGIFTWALIPFVLVGIAGSLCGRSIGSRIIEKINADTMRKLIYLFLGVAGLLNVINNL